MSDPLQDPDFSAFLNEMDDQFDLSFLDQSPTIGPELSFAELGSSDLGADAGKAEP